MVAGLSGSGPPDEPCGSALAQELGHPLSLVQALQWTGWVHQFRRESQATREQAEATLTLAAEQGFPYWQAQGTILRGWVLAMQGQGEEGIAQVNEGITAFRATEAELNQPYFLALLAEAYGKAGKPEEGFPMLAEALAIVDKNRQRFYEAELYRLKGQLLLQQSSDNHTDAETCYQQAIAIAQNQQAKSWELRAATSLAKLWQSQNKRQDAYDLLAPVYAWFAEGFDTADLKDARALLHELL